MLKTIFCSFFVSLYFVFGSFWSVYLKFSLKVHINLIHFKLCWTNLLITTDHYMNYFYTRNKKIIPKRHLFSYTKSPKSSTPSSLIDFPSALNCNSTFRKCFLSFLILWAMVNCFPTTFNYQQQARMQHLKNVSQTD